jgi:flavin-dependent dehydrogenase
MADDIYDLCVVGAGLIGSAAARHASQGGRVCLVGPKEPEVRF